MYIVRMRGYIHLYDHRNLAFFLLSVASNSAISLDCVFICCSCFRFSDADNSCLFAFVIISHLVDFGPPSNSLLLYAFSGISDMFGGGFNDFCFLWCRRYSQKARTARMMPIRAEPTAMPATTPGGREGEAVVEVSSGGV